MGTHLLIFLLFLIQCNANNSHCPVSGLTQLSSIVSKGEDSISGVDDGMEAEGVDWLNVMTSQLLHSHLGEHNIDATWHIDSNKNMYSLKSLILVFTRSS